MTIKPARSASEPIAYDKFAGDLTWDLFELQFRTQAAIDTLHSTEAIDCDHGAGLAVTYVLQGIGKRLEELALRAEASERVYVASIDQTGSVR